MKNGLIEVYCGEGRGKTSLAIGKSLQACAQGQSVIAIQFLKGKEKSSLEFLEEMRGLDYKIFRFEKRNVCYEKLSEQEKTEERRNILNGINFARKVVKTHECDFLIMDEILGLLEYGIITLEMLEEILKAGDGDMHIVLTGRHLPQGLAEHVDSITTVTTVDRR